MTSHSPLDLTRLWLALEALFSHHEEDALRIALEDESGKTMIELLFLHLHPGVLKEDDEQLFLDFLNVLLLSIHVLWQEHGELSSAELLRGVAHRVQENPIIGEFFTLQECQELVASVADGREALLALSDLLTGAYLLFTAFQDVRTAFLPHRMFLHFSNAYLHAPAAHDAATLRL